MSDLTAKQSAFVREYLVDLNATQAAIRAGYSPESAANIGYENLRKPEIEAAIAAAVAERSKRVEVTADEVLRELKRIALSDIRRAYTEGGRLKPISEMPEDIARVVAGIETEELWGGQGEDRAQVGDTVKIKLWDKLRALELLGKHLKLYTDKHEHAGEGGGPVSFTIIRKPRGE